MHVRVSLCVWCPHDGPGCGWFIFRSPPATVPGQPPPQLGSYDADYHIGARMKIRQNHCALLCPLFDSPPAALCLSSTVADDRPGTARSTQESTGAMSARASASRASAKTPSRLTSKHFQGPRTAMPAQKPCSARRRASKSRTAPRFSSSSPSRTNRLPNQSTPTSN